MIKKAPSSLIMFIVALLISIGVIIAALLFNLLNWNKQNLIYLGFAQMLVAIISTVGIYTGIKYRSLQKKSINLNRLGLWGNVIILTYTAVLMVMALIK
jgi:multisubunit Na+/H+ antiporter MnhB subunit